MRSARRSTLIALGILLLSIGGCKVSCTTANISSLKIAKDQQGQNVASTFGPGDKFYAVAQVSNSPSTYKVQFRMLYDNVPGQKSGEVIPNSEKTLDVEGSQQVYLSIGLPPAGWADGRYRVEATMTDKDGKQIDKEEATFNVSGFAAKAPPPQPPQPPPAPSEDQGEEENPESDEQ